ncbi:hypothetical protein PLICRDRAFT_177215 [Plicaturopsis crispa FD-325 SS-3]|nr:hypothetical protein PLICRDRAFT_177215 [Plicaturopsis crispa FD-325 SS-3]
MSVQNKHFINAPTDLVLESLEGLCAVNHQLALDRENKVVYVESPDRSKVALLCGGGSGHEPAHPGFVGSGMLTAAACGSVFASPNASQVRRAIDLVDNDKGTVIIVKNYTGDVLNFGLAKEQYAAVHPHKADRLKFVIVGDDVAVGKKQGSIVGRRGLAGTVLVYKIAGAAARGGASLDDVYDLATWVAGNVVTVGVGLEHCHVPGTAAAESHLGTDEIEIGMGIHNESGNKRISPVPTLDTLIPQLIEMLTSMTDPDRSFLPFQGGGKDNVVLLVNNLGGISELELAGITGAVRKHLDGLGVKIHRAISGTFMTSLNMPGFSITLLLLPPVSSPSKPSPSLILSLLDEPTSTPGWKWSSPSVPAEFNAKPLQATGPAKTKEGEELGAPDPEAFTAAIVRAARALIGAEPEITRMDSIAGDGDCGLTLKSGASAVLKKVEDGTIKGTDVVGAIITIAQVAEEAMGGTSGALYSIFFSALAQGLVSSQSSTATPEVWAQALKSARAKLYTYTLARPPSRTLVDPLAAFVDATSSGFAAAVKAAGTAAEATVRIDAKAGRSAYVDSQRLMDEKIPDPGAWGVKVIVESLFQ